MENRSWQEEYIDELFEKIKAKNNLIIFESFLKSFPKIKDYKNIVCSISGGADSDIMFDIVNRLDIKGAVKYVFFDTGIEYQATKKHLEYLEKKYHVKIDRMPAKMPVPSACRKYGLPFWSKHVSEMIERLQTRGFKWEDEPFEDLVKKYPKCRAALRWWCNEFGENSRFNISYVKWLKEFIIECPPPFKISNKCCDGAKKDNAKIYLTEHNANLNLVGIRKAEGGARSTAYKSCFDVASDGETWDNYRPIFWYTDKDKKEYEELFKIKHSDCYSVYGLSRTGCAGCPFGKHFLEELEVCLKYETKLYKAILNIFGPTYEYTKKFIEFRRLKNGK